MFWAYAAAVEFRMPKSLEPGTDKERFINMEPAESNSYRDILDDSKVRPIKIGGMWYPKPHSPTEDVGKLVILHFHGGAYVLGGCRPKEGGWGPDLLAKRVSGLALCPQYRLAIDMDPTTRFPAAIQDGLTAYLFLLSKGISASNIVLSGDSAGGNLAIMLLRYLVEHEEVTPLPRAVLLWSPWVDLALNFSSLEKQPNFKKDYIPSSLGKWGIRAYLGGRSVNHPFVSSLRNEFATKVPIFLHTGTEELLHDDHMKYFQSMNKISDNQLKIYQSLNAPHDIFAAGPILGFEQEALTAMDAASEFLLDENLPKVNPDSLGGNPTGIPGSHGERRRQEGASSP